MSNIFLCVAAVLLTSVYAQTSTPPPGSTSTPAPSPEPQPISLTQIALRAEDLAATVRDILRTLPSDTALSTFDEELRDQEDLIRDRLTSSREAMAGRATLLEIREEIREWRTYSTRESRDRKTLTAWGSTCEQHLKAISSTRAVWEATLDSAKDQPQYKTVMPQINSALKDIREVQATAEQRLRTVLELQARSSKQALTIADVIEKLTEARQQVHAHLFYPDAPPIWQVAREAQTDPLGTVLGRSLRSSYVALAQSVAGRTWLVFSVVVILVLALFSIHRLSSVILRIKSSDEAIVRTSQLLQRPLALALLVTGPVMLLAYPLARMSAVLLWVQLLLIPIARLLPFYTSARRFVYFVCTFVALNAVAGALDLDAVLRRYLLAGLFAAAICVCSWWGRPARFRRTQISTESLHEMRFARGFLAVLIPLLIANVLGFLLLSHLVRLSLILSTCFWLLLYTFARSMTTLFSAVLRLPRISSLASVRMYEAGLVRWCERLLHVSAVLCWILLTLRLLELDQAVLKAVRTALTATPGGKTLNFSAGDVLGFLTILILGYLTASGLRFILREEILPRWRLSRGVPETISSSLYYLCLLLVFFMSLAAAGIQLDKLTVLTGAFGVGIGFGLQNVVNNFVSGLILQFERPIRVGDVLEVGTLAGEIRRIGVRSSTMRTFQGAEVIIPNSAFVSDKVVNWTLSEPRRRVEIPVHVAYGTDPERVVNMLIEIAASQARVLRDPAPSAVFTGFGDSSLDFLLMFWAEQDTHFQLRSDVSIRINAALSEAGIDIPFPQREIRVHSEQSGAFRHSA